MSKLHVLVIAASEKEYKLAKVEIEAAGMNPGSSWETKREHNPDRLSTAEMATLTQDILGAVDEADIVVVMGDAGAFYAGACVVQSIPVVVVGPFRDPTLNVRGIEHTDIDSLRRRLERVGRVVSSLRDLDTPKYNPNVALHAVGDALVKKATDAMIATLNPEVEQSSADRTQPADHDQSGQVQGGGAGGDPSGSSSEATQPGQFDSSAPVG